MRGVLGALLARPLAYDLIQLLAGAPLVDRRMAPHVAALSRDALVVDLGGGTGVVRRHCAASCRYVCIDLDLGRLRTVRERHAGAMAVLADATRPPLLPGRADLVVCRAITHHLPDGALEALLDEGARLLRPGGALLLLEILWPPAHGVARLLWHLDRGSNPRTAGHLRAALAARFDVVHAESFTVLHRYLLLIGRRREEGRRATVSVS